MANQAVTTYRPTSLAERIAHFFISWKDAFRDSDAFGKAAMVSNVALPGLGSMLFGNLEKGLGTLAAYVFVCFLSVYVGIQAGSGVAMNSFSLAVLYLVLILAFFLIHVSAISTSTYKARQRIHHENKWCPDSFLIKGSKGLAKDTVGYFSTFSRAWKNGNGATKTQLATGFLVMGIPEMMGFRFVQGIALLLVQVFCIVYLGIQGAADLGQFFALGVSSYPNTTLLNGILAITVILVLIGAYIVHLKSLLKMVVERQEEDENHRKSPVDLVKGELSSLINEKFSIPGLIVPVVGAVVFTIIPIVFMITTAFTNYSAVTIPGYENYNPSLGIPLVWKGFEAFGRLFANTSSLIDMVNVFGWTMVWAFFATFTCYFGGLLLALLLNKKAIKGKVVYRSIFVVAMALPQFVSLLVVRLMFERYGIVNNILMELGWINERIEFWVEEGWAKTLIILINMWVGIPYYMLLMSGLLLNIPKDLYEAADIEGASRWQQFRTITFPHIFFMTTPTLISSFVSNINNFNVIWFLTGGGEAGTSIGAIGSTAGNTDILITWLYKLTFNAGGQTDYNLAAVVGIIMFIISATVSLVIFQRSKAYTAEEEYR